jgi:hypothetical protein
MMECICSSSCASQCYNECTYGDPMSSYCDSCVTSYCSYEVEQCQYDI